MSISYQQIDEQIKQQLATIANSDAVLQDDTDIVNGLGLDSLKVLDLLMDIEDEFNISIPMNVLADVHTIKDLSEKIHELITAREEG